jgi:hypothetical protein
MKCFVIMTFGNPKVNPEQARRLDLIYSQWIKPAVESIKDPFRPDEQIVCHRADKSVRPEEIITHVIEHLMTSDIVIADLSGRNPNVFYELGVRHAIGNNTVLIAEDLDDIPFDLRGMRAIVYKYEPEYMLKLKSSLDEAIKEIFKDPNRIDNPVRRFIYNTEVDKLINQPTLPGYQIIKDIISELSSLKKEMIDQVSEIRHLTKVVISSGDNQPLLNTNKVIDLSSFEGVWRDSITGTTMYPRVVNGQLLGPYCYYGNSELTGHFYNCKLIGDTLFARFRWFKTEVSGYLYGQIKSEDRINRIIGGWWFSEDLPPEALKGIVAPDFSLPGINRLNLIRITEFENIPSWVNDYFEGRIKDDAQPLSVYSSLGRIIRQAFFTISRYFGSNLADSWLEGQPGSKASGQIFHLSKFTRGARAILGSDKKGSIFIWIPEAHPYHAEITLQKNRAVLRHIAGSGETRVNGVAIKKHILKNEDIIEIGNTKLKYRERRRMFR